MLARKIGAVLALLLACKVACSIRHRHSFGLLYAKLAITRNTKVVVRKVVVVPCSHTGICASSTMYRVTAALMHVGRA
jgi:hypothetical protein